MHLDFLKKFVFGNKKIARKLSEVILIKGAFGVYAFMTSGYQMTVSCTAVKRIRHERQTALQK